MVLRAGGAPEGSEIAVAWRGLADPNGSPESSVEVLHQDLGSLQTDGQADETGSDTASEPLRPQAEIDPR